MFENILKFAVIFFATVSHIVATEEKGCERRDYGKEHIVCVCNSTYCDTILPIQKVDSPNYLKYTSNKAGLRFNKSQGVFEQITNTKKLINIEYEEYQSVDGFGGAFTDAVGINLQTLSIEAQQLLLRSYFAEDGIGYTLGRVPIGCTDFSTHSYSYDDTSFEDPELKYFKLADEDYKYKIPFIQEATKLSNNKLKLVAVAWTSPKWMKIIPLYATMFGEIKKKLYQSWADYHLKFLEAYDDNNITFWSISTGNEPSIGYTPLPIPIVAFTPWSLANWVENHFGPTLKQSKFSEIKIMVMDDERSFLPWFVDKMFKNPVTKNFTDIIAVHWYLDKIAPTFLLDMTHKKYPTKSILLTEACRGQYLWEKSINLGAWDRGEDIAVGIMENMQHWVTGWIDWNLALDTTGGPCYIPNNVDSPILINATAGEFYKQPMFYVLGHFSKFVPPGSVRIKSSLSFLFTLFSNIDVIAFKRPDEGVVLIILNKANNEVDTTVIDKVKGQIPLRLSARSITSLVYW